MGESKKDWIEEMNDIADANGQDDRAVLEDMICFLNRKVETPNGGLRALGEQFLAWYRENVNKSPSERV